VTGTAEAADPLRVSAIVGSWTDSDLHERLHRLEHRGAVDTVEIKPGDMQRRRFRAHSAAGRTVEIALPRTISLFDGAVLWLDDASALVLRVAAQRWLRLVPRTKDDALALGYHAGNLHWRVRFNGDALLVALDEPQEAYLVRLGELAAADRLDCSIVEPAPC
jgi:urease accessory protein